MNAHEKALATLIEEANAKFESRMMERERAEKAALAAVTKMLNEKRDQAMRRVSDQIPTALLNFVRVRNLDTTKDARIGADWLPEQFSIQAPGLAEIRFDVRYSGHSPLVWQLHYVNRTGGITYVQNNGGQPDWVAAIAFASEAYRQREEDQKLAEEQAAMSDGKKFVPVPAEFKLVEAIREVVREEVATAAAAA